MEVKVFLCVRRAGGKADLFIFVNEFLLTVLLFQSNGFGDQ